MAGKTVTHNRYGSLRSEAFQIVLDHISDIAWLKDKESRYVAVNRAFLSFHGFSPSQVIGRKDEDLFPLKHALQRGRNDNAVMSDGRGTCVEETLEAADGRRVKMQTTREVVSNEGGKVAGIAGVSRDTAEGAMLDASFGIGSASETALGSGDEEYRAIFEKAVVGIFRSTVDGKILNVNPALACMLGYECREEVMSAVTDIGNQIYVDPKDRDRCMELAEEQEVVEGFETAFRTKGRGVVNVLLTFHGIRDDKGRISCIEGIAQDVTERRRAEEARRLAEERYRDLYENAVEGMFRMSSGGGFTTANPALARMLGYDSVEDFINATADAGKRFFANQKRRKDYIHAMENHAYVRDFEAQVYCRDESMQWVSINARRAGDEGGAVYYEGTIVSISERKKLEAQLRQAQKMESIGTLAGGVAHDFNNVLTTVMGYCSLIAMKAGENNPFMGYINQIMEAAGRASTLTQTLLAFSRKQAIEAKTIDINETIRSVEKLLRRAVGEDVDLKTSLSPGKLLVFMGDGHVGQILMNLVSNARDAMPEGGEVTIRTEQVHLSGEVSSAYDGKEGAYVCIEVCDTGSGMDERTRDQIFDPFFTTKEVGKGTGLGLSVVYGIVNQNHGYIDVKSDIGKGTTFSIYFPLKEVAGDGLPLQERAEFRGTNEVILVAEDNSQVREIVTTTLREFGYTVIEAVDGQDAVEKFAENRDIVDLLLFDVIMPRKNGKEAYIEAKSLKPDIRGIFISGYTGDILSRKGISREGIPVISKPIAIEKLLRQIREVLDTKLSQLTLFP